MSIKDITTVITSFKSEDKIINCLNSINSQCKVLVIENSNNLNFKREIEKNFKNVECFLTGENLGYGKANNIGLAKVDTKYALILNPDTILEQNTFENFLGVANQFSDFAIIAPAQQEKEIKKTITTDFLIKHNTNSSERIEVNNVKGFAMFLKIDEFKEVGFFDENFFMYFEEIDLCKRLKKFNKKIYLVPSIKIIHHGGQSHSVFINHEMELSRNWHWMWSTFNYNKKYKGYLISLLITFPRLLSAIIKFLFYTCILKKNKKDIYFYRYLGLINAITGKKSWYRPNV